MAGLLLCLLLAWLPDTEGVSGPSFPFQTLRLERDRHFPAPLRVTAEDLVLELAEGAALFAAAEGGPTAIVLVGKGSLRFAPAVVSEQRQLALFAGSPVLAADFEAAFLRLHPRDFASVFEGPPPLPSPSAVLLRRAEAIFRREIGRSYAADLGEAPAPVFSVLPAPGDFLAEVRTRRHGVLTYARLGANPEDITLLERDGAGHIASYPSRRHREAFGFGYGDEHGLPYEASRYEVEVSVDPARAEVRGRALVAIQSLEEMETAGLRLDGGLQVESVRSAERGSHQFLQQKSRDTLLVRFRPPLRAGSRVALEIRYGGRLEPQDLAAPPAERSDGRPPGRRPPGSREVLLYSNRVYWFPQSPVRNHATASLSVTVPAGYSALASGLAEPVEPEPGAAWRRFDFRNEKPIRYLSLLVARLDPVDVPMPDTRVPIGLVSSPSLRRRARALLPEAARIVGFFHAQTGDVPYPRLTLALLETSRPAAHSPAYLALLGEPSGWIPARAGDNPTYFSGEPVFHLAHEIAHQWWGQAVGWRNYREQWLSEALAQYFAALYVRESRGERAFRDVISWMQRWALEGSEKGPISLGFRVGQVTSCDECFPAVVYDRGALVLHMARESLGDDAFFRGLRLYYERWKFRRAGTEDLRKALEESSGRSLQRFFEQWVRGDATPELRWTARRLSEQGKPHLRLAVEQAREAMELPLRVSIEYEDHPPTRRLLRVHLPREEFSIALEGRFRRVRLNEGLDALCRLQEVRP